MVQEMLRILSADGKSLNYSIALLNDMYHGIYVSKTVFAATSKTIADNIQ